MEEKEDGGLHISTHEDHSCTRAVRVAFPVDPPQPNGAHHAAVVRADVGRHYVDTAPRICFELNPSVHARGTLSRAEWEQIKRAGDRAWSEYEARFMATCFMTACPIDRCSCGAKTREEHDELASRTQVASGSGS